MRLNVITPAITTVLKVKDFLCILTNILFAPNSTPDFFPHLPYGATKSLPGHVSYSRKLK